VFCEAGAWKNFHDLEDSLSLDELLELYEASIERFDRNVRVLAAAVGADVGPPPESRRERSDDRPLPPAYSIDPTKGGEAKPLESEEDVFSLPINLGYEIIENSENSEID
jgi:hypothetical protein